MHNLQILFIYNINIIFIIKYFRFHFLYFFILLLFYCYIVFYIVYFIFNHLSYNTKSIIKTNILLILEAIWNALFLFIVEFIQSKYKSNRQYTPGELGRAQPLPHDIIPICIPLHNNGPPLSPYNVFQS